VTREEEDIPRDVMVDRLKQLLNPSSSSSEEEEEKEAAETTAADGGKRVVSSI
jgi:hypothetical protein